MNAFSKKPAGRQSNQQPPGTGTYIFLMIDILAEKFGHLYRLEKKISHWTPFGIKVTFLPQNPLETEKGGSFLYLCGSMNEKILILDFGSQYTQLIARSVREANVYCEIIPYHQKIEPDPTLKGIILSGSPFSVNDAQAPMVDVKALHRNFPHTGNLLWCPADGQRIWRSGGQQQ